MPACYRDTPQLRVKLYRSVCRIWRIASASTPYRKIICRVSIGSWDDGSSTWARSAFTAFTRFMASTDSVRARQPAPPPPLLRPLLRRCCPSGAASPSAPWARRLPAPLGAPTGLRAVHPSRSPVSIAARGTLRAGLSWSGASRFLLSPLDVDDVETVDLLPSVSFDETALPRCFFSEISFLFLELESYLEEAWLSPRTHTSFRTISRLWGKNVSFKRSEPVQRISAGDVLSLGQSVFMRS